jgi:hypothetical protein
MELHYFWNTHELKIVHCNFICKHGLLDFQNFTTANPCFFYQSC